MAGWGGARHGAGRKRKIGTLKDPAALPASTRRALTIQRSIAAHRIETKIDLDGAVPLEIMVDNMRFAHNQAQNAAQEIARIEQETGQMADLLLYKTMMSFRSWHSGAPKGPHPTCIRA